MRDYIVRIPVMLFRRTPEAVHDSLVMQHGSRSNRTNAEANLHSYLSTIVLQVQIFRSENLIIKQIRPDNFETLCCAIRGIAFFKIPLLRDS